MLFTFPSRYLFTIGLLGVFSLARWSWLIHTGFLVSRATQDTAKSIKHYVYGIITLFDHAFQNVPLPFYKLYRSPTTPNWPEPTRFGLFPVRSPLLRESLLFSFPPVNEMFQFTGLAFRLTGILHLQCNGLPHSDICGSIVICTSPQLIAAYRVLLRL